jgi:uncharacterized phage-associated protein
MVLSKQDMSYPAKTIADYFIKTAPAHGDNSLTPMKLQKLVYYAHGWYLAVTGEPLIDEPVQAWTYGPVIPSIYHQFKGFGDKPITELTSFYFDGGRSFKRENVKLINDSPVVALLNKIWDLYGNFTGVQLSNATHEPGTPWHTIFEQNHGQLEKGQSIPNDLIEKHFESLLVKA